ncbi:MAG: hypothetical protein DBX59_05290 [Bacillota bacterium]|nr:MAG: hypothetical protein DBX59_05290 [Bacillota bacterium]
MKKIKIGVLGGFRGKSMIDWCLQNGGETEVVAICDRSETVRAAVQKSLNEVSSSAKLYDNFDEFLSHGMDAVVLANYANEHAPFAVRCLEKGLHVFSEVLPVQTLAEAVKLVEAVEKSGKIYVYGENYCYFPATLEMKRLYRNGVLGTFEYGEGEYVHNCEPIWPNITYGDPEHWRNTMSAFFYCTHSAGPLLHITGLRPVKVTGFEIPPDERSRSMGAKSGAGAVEMITLENGGIVKSLHALSLVKNSVWYSVYGTKGRAESQRENAGSASVSKIYLKNDTAAHPDGEWAEYFPSPDGGEPKSGKFGNEREADYRVAEDNGNPDARLSFGHYGSDYFTMENFVRAIRGEPADVADVYEALDMAFIGMFAHFSALSGGASMEIPNFRDKSVRERFRNDTRCCDKKVAGEQLLPSSSASAEEIPQSVYDAVRKKYIDSLQ